MDVLLAGKKVGDTATVAQVACGNAKIVAVSEPGTVKPIGKVKSTAIACQAVTTIEFTDADLAAVAPPPPPGGAPPPPPSPTPTPAPALTPTTDTYDPATP
jgi:hypothetical protein